MKLKKALVLILFPLLSFSKNAQCSGRGELQRFTLLHDLFLIDRDLKQEKIPNFFSVDLFFSSGLKKIIGDIKNGTNDSANQVQKQLAMFNTLTKYVNTEKILDLNINVAIPLPDIRWGKNQLYPNLFYQFNAGVSVSFSNAGDATKPSAQTYIRKESKLGVSTYFLRKKENKWNIALYRLTRSDNLNSVNSADLASDGKLFDLSSLSKNHNILALDLSYLKTNPKNKILIEVREFKIMEMSSDQKSLYGTRPLLHLRYEKLPKGDKIRWTPFTGLHFRRWYTIDDGIYGGFIFSYYKNSPFHFKFKISKQFLTFMPEFKTKYFKFSYSIKNPYRNPRDELWSSSIHNLSINFPMP